MKTYWLATREHSSRKLRRDYPTLDDWKEAAVYWGAVSDDDLADFCKADDFVAAQLLLSDDFWAWWEAVPELVS